jgi:hypothetical protein
VIDLPRKPPAGPTTKSLRNVLAYADRDVRSVKIRQASQLNPGISKFITSVLKLSTLEHLEIRGGRDKHQLKHYARPKAKLKNLTIIDTFDVQVEAGLETPKFSPLPFIHSFADCLQSLHVDPMPRGLFTPWVHQTSSPDPESSSPTLPELRYLRVGDSTDHPRAPKTILVRGLMAAYM